MKIEYTTIRRFSQAACRKPVVLVIHPMQDLVPQSGLVSQTCGSDDDAEGKDTGRGKALAHQRQPDGFIVQPGRVTAHRYPFADMEMIAMRRRNTPAIWSGFSVAACSVSTGWLSAAFSTSEAGWPVSKREGEALVKLRAKR